MRDLSFEAVCGPIVGRLGQLEDPTLDALDSNTGGNCDIVLKDRPLRQFYWEEVGPELETRTDGAKIRPRGKVRRPDGHLFHARYEVILRIVRNASVQSRRDVLEEYTIVFR